MTETPPPPAEPQGKDPADSPLAEVDLDGDGQAERVYVNLTGDVRVVTAEGTELFTYMLPTKSGKGVKAEVYPLPDRPPLLRIYWDWCPYGYPDNLFVWYDRQSGKLTTDREWGSFMDRCGSYTETGDGRFEAMFRNNELYFTRTETWKESGLVTESNKVELSRFRIDRLPDVLGMLTDEEISNPEVLFATPDLYRQFRDKAKLGWVFERRADSEPGTLLLEVLGEAPEQIRLKLSYEQNAVGWIQITHLEWLK